MDHLNWRRDMDVRKMWVPLLAIAGALALLAAKNWASDPEWVKTRYGNWGGPGVDPRPGAMDSPTVKDYAPKSSLLVSETHVAKAKYPAIDVHSHINAKTPEE